MPMLLSPSGVASGKLYGSGTPYATPEAYDRAVTPISSNTSSSAAGGRSIGFQGVFEVSGRIDSKKLESLLDQKKNEPKQLAPSP